MTYVQYEQVHNSKIHVDKVLILQAHRVQTHWILVCHLPQASNAQQMIWVLQASATTLHLQHILQELECRFSIGGCWDMSAWMHCHQLFVQSTGQQSGIAIMSHGIQSIQICILFYLFFNGVSHWDFSQVDGSQWPCSKSEIEWLSLLMLWCHNGIFTCARRSIESNLIGITVNIHVLKLQKSTYQDMGTVDISALS